MLSHLPDDSCSGRSRSRRSIHVPNCTGRYRSGPLTVVRSMDRKHLHVKACGRVTRHRRL
jgi:hypothetical protein